VLAYLRTRPGVRIIGPASADGGLRVPTVSFVVDGRDSESVVRGVDPQRVGIRFGDFYSRRLIDDLGLSDHKGVVRASFAHYNTFGDADRLIDALDRVLVGPVQAEHVHQGRSVGVGGILPAVKQGTKGSYLEILRDDRSDR
jgi:selenocysteine lyase/cysteine desulfurase